MRNALLTGINTYPNAPLALCVQDVSRMSDYLQSIGYHSIRKLVDGEATFDRIVSELETLVGDAVDGDDLLWLYSGHGMIVPGAASNVVDEAICPIDYESNPPFNDEVLKKALSHLSGVNANLTIVLDCCHSGRLTKSKAVPPRKDLVPKHVPAAPIPSLAMRRNRFAVKQEQGYLVVDPTMRHLVFAACHRMQVAADGAFSGSSLVDELVQNPGTTNLQVIQGVRRRLAEAGYDQQPQIEGPTWMINGYFGGGR